jgi:hypothetical protein
MSFQSEVTMEGAPIGPPNIAPAPNFTPWLIRLARRFEVHGLSVVPQSHNRLRVPHMIKEMRTWSYSLAGVLCDMFLSEPPSTSTRIMPYPAPGWSDNGVFIYHEGIDETDHMRSEVVFEIPSPVLIWAMQRRGGDQACLVISAGIRRMKFMDAAKMMRDMQEAYQQIDKINAVNSVGPKLERPSDQTMRIAKRLQERPRTKPKPSSYF